MTIEEFNRVYKADYWYSTTKTELSIVLFICADKPYYRKFYKDTLANGDSGYIHNFINENNEEAACILNRTSENGRGYVGYHYKKVTYKFTSIAPFILSPAPRNDISPILPFLNFIFQYHLQPYMEETKYNTSTMTNFTEPLLLPSEAEALRDSQCEKFRDQLSLS